MNIWFDTLIIDPNFLLKENSLEMASPRQEQAQHEMMKQMMQMSKELSYEKTAHKKVIAQLEETKSCMKRVEAASLAARILSSFVSFEPYALLTIPVVALDRNENK